MSAFGESASVILATADSCREQIEQAAQLCIDSIKSGGKLLICGNGGSAAEASHMTAELVVRLRSTHERKALPAVCLGSNIAVLTACANDYGYPAVFAREVEALGNPEDVLICLTTSGKSSNVLAAENYAYIVKRLKCVAITGDVEHRTNLETGARGWCDVHIRIPSTNTARIQEATLVVIHELCRMIEEGVCYE